MEVTLSRNVLSILERSLLIAGASLLVFYGCALLDRHVFSEIAFRELGMLRVDDEPVASRRNERVDYTLWSAKRLKEYGRSLLVNHDPPIAALRIGKLHLRVAVFQNTDEISLNRGVGWIAGTARPGEPGNVGIAGHRDGFFRCLKDVATGDLIELASSSGLAVYAVDQVEIVEPNNVGVLRPRGQPSLTLVTCYPFYFVGSAPRRFIVHGVLKRPSAMDGVPGRFALALSHQFENKEKRK